MSAQKPSVPKGTRDYSPGVMARRNYIFRTITDTFESFGYQPIETPAMENLSTLLGKYGEEGDRLLFRILNSGNFPGDADREDWLNADPARLALQICDRGLRYDLTVPFARYVVQHRNDISFPFKRYQIQPVWRADRPQKGRYREFYQCDADVIGSDSLLNERELIEITIGIFAALGIKCSIKINNRKLLSGIASQIGLKERLGDLTTSIDKLDKIGREKVMEELREKGIPGEEIQRLFPILSVEGGNQDKLEQLASILNADTEGTQGITEMNRLLKLCEGLGSPGQIQFDIKLARGLNYYTGTIIEVLSDDLEIGSICGGGRYDDLTGVFGMPGVSGVGVSFGADRIYDVMSRLDLFPGETLSSTRLLFVNFGEEREGYILNMLSRLRKEGIASELYPDAAKLRKQLSYANNKNIPFVALIGEEEMKKGMITLKNMLSGKQEEVSLEEMISEIRL